MRSCVLARSGLDRARLKSGGVFRRVAAIWLAVSLVVPALVAGAALAPGASASAAARAGAPGVLFKDKGVLAYGRAPFLGSPAGRLLDAPVVAMTAMPDGEGYWLVTADGAVFAYGKAKNYGQAHGQALRSPVVIMQATSDGKGYWLVSLDGEVRAFGDARGQGSLRRGETQYPVVGFAATPTGAGYWLATSHGQVYSFGQARSYGSLGHTDLHDIPVVAIAPTLDGRGYWLVQGGGEVRPYGDAPKLGQMPRGHPPVSGIAVTGDGQGYWLVCGDGEVDAFGDAVYHGGNNRAVPRPPIDDIVADPASGGYWLLDGEAFPVKFAGPANGTTLAPGAAQRNSRIVSVAESQLGPSRGGGGYCNPYGPCEKWCALFATWVWEQAGVAIPRYAFVGDVYYWAAKYTGVTSALARPRQGDLVLYGTGPGNLATSPHIGVVAQVWPDGSIITVEGDAGPGPGGWTSVLANGPYYPAQSFFANGMPIYAFAAP